MKIKISRESGIIDEKEYHVMNIRLASLRKRNHLVSQSIVIDII
jgi:hypothetical protein